MFYRDPGEIIVDGRKLKDYPDGLIGDIDAFFAHDHEPEWIAQVAAAFERDMVAIRCLSQCNFALAAGSPALEHPTNDETEEENGDW